MGRHLRRVDEDLLVHHLDDAWCTVPAIKRRVGNNGWAPEDICRTLRSLAAAGKIERREHVTAAPKLRKGTGGALKIEYYRRLQ